MADRAFLQPKSMDMPVQGDWEFSPVYVFLEDTTMAGLQAQLDAASIAQQQNLTDLYVIEEIEYQVVVTKPAIGMNPAELLYTCMVWGSWAHRI